MSLNIPDNLQARFIRQPNGLTDIDLTIGPTVNALGRDWEELPVNTVNTIEELEDRLDQIHNSAVVVLRLDDLKPELNQPLVELMACRDDVDLIVWHWEALEDYPLE